MRGTYVQIENLRGKVRHDKVRACHIEKLGRIVHIPRKRNSQIGKRRPRVEPQPTRK